MTQDQQIRQVQHKLGLVADGIDGPKTWRKIHGTIVGMPSNKPIATVSGVIPTDDHKSICDIYGEPGDESKLVRFNFPYPMKLYGHHL